MSDSVAGDPPPNNPLARKGDPHGEAALQLVESLIHKLVENSTLTLAAAIEVVEIAVDAQIEVSDDRGDGPHDRLAVSLLCSVSSTLGIDSC